jgi:transcriptional regulator with XRE-family HTH domain
MDPILEEQAGLTQRQVAAKAGLPRRRLHVIETDAVLPTQEEITRIQKALEIDNEVSAAGGQQ